MSDQLKISQLLRNTRRQPATKRTLEEATESDPPPKAVAVTAPAAVTTEAAAVPSVSTPPTETAVRLGALPSHYQLLITQFEALDVVLSAFRARRKLTYFDDLVHEVEGVSKRYGVEQAGSPRIRVS